MGDQKIDVELVKPEKSKAMLTQGSVVRVIVKMAGGMMIGFFAVSAFHLTDTYFVSQLGTDALAAMSFTFPVVMLVGGLTMGIGVGASTIISQAIGGGRHHEMKRLTTDSLLLGLVVVSILIVIGMLTIKPLFTVLGADEKTMPLITSYMQIWYVGMFFLVIPMLGNNAMRAMGDTFSPSIIMVVDVGLNTILDPLLIFGIGPFPQMGIAGAALGTVISRSLALCASLYILHFKKSMLTFELPKFSEVIDSWRRILYIGLPMVGTFMLMPVTAGIITRMMAGYGVEVVAAFGAGSRLERLAVLPVMAIGASMGPFVGQNVGAKLFGRLYEARDFAMKFSLCWGTLTVVVLMVFSGNIARIFSDDPKVCEAIVLYFYLVPISYGFKGLAHVSNASMNAINHPYHAAGFSMVYMAGLMLPMAAIGGWLCGFKGMLIGLVSADIIMGCASMRWLLILFDRLVRREAEDNHEGDVLIQTSAMAAEIAIEDEVEF